MDEKVANVADQVNSVLDNLADKLKVPIEHLWGVLVQQAKVVLVTNTAIIGLWAVYVVVWGVLLKKAFHWWAANARTDNEDVVAACSVVWVVVSGIVFISSTFYVWFHVFPELITCWLNPEYWALAKIRGE